ncbi:hypothetical protein K502DRAFT_349693 [Neoconidiobolus thromboides FSU 785]|nr:hypothetical protein K502DRAFT_349693 [Neoconidiobolus thromboides FSU 785]
MNNQEPETKEMEQLEPIFDSQQGYRKTPMEREISKKTRDRLEASLKKGNSSATGSIVSLLFYPFTNSASFV